jgi:hypothetical protein
LFWIVVVLCRPGVSGARATPWAVRSGGIFAASSRPRKTGAAADSNAVNALAGAAPQNRWRRVKSDLTQTHAGFMHSGEATQPGMRLE